MRVRAFAATILLAILAAPTAAMASGWTWFHLIPGIDGSNLHVLLYALGAVMLLLLALKLRPAFADESQLVPSDQFNLRTISELIVEMMMGMMKQIIGPDYKRWVPFIGCLAFVILLGNLFALLPGSNTANANLNTTFAMAIVAFVAYNYAGVKTHGVLGWLAHFMGPLEGTMKYIMAPIMIPIEIISHLARPLSLGLRLFGNMTGDHMVLAVFMGMVPLPLLYPLPFLLLGTIVSVVQTLVFCLLTMVYIGQAVVHEEH